MSFTNVQLVLSSRDATGGVYNNSTFNAKGQNLIQGNVKEIAVAEVNFPYDIPNIQEGFNTFEIYPYPSGDYEAIAITVAPGFYTGTELAAAIQTDIQNQADVSDPQIPIPDVPTCSYSTSNNLFTFTLANPVTPGLGWKFASDYTYFPPEVPGLTVVKNTLGKDILSIMGFLQTQDGISPTVDQANPVTSDQSAPLAFTQYVDICSTQLCAKQRFSDGSTTNLARRNNVICRLFICDNVSLTTPDVEGSRPFIINRQYYNARIMRWTTDSSIGTIDIQLYDDTGQPLRTTWQPRPFQLTFNCYEQDEEGSGISAGEAIVAAMTGETPTKYAAFKEKNVSQAWAQLAHQHPGRANKRI